MVVVHQNVHVDNNKEGSFMVQFEKPVYKITDYVESNFFGKFELEPLERGFGTTLGKAFRTSSKLSMVLWKMLPLSF